MTEIAITRTPSSHYAEQCVTFATGRRPTRTTPASSNAAHGNLANANYTIATMMADYTQAIPSACEPLGTERNQTMNKRSRHSIAD